MNEKRTLVSFDWAIKNILQDKANYDVLEGFLSTLLEKDIKILSIMESESNQEHQSDKFNRVDLVVEDEHGEILIIEVQNDREIHYLERLLYGSSKTIVERIESGESYENVKKVISINILYFLLGDGETDYIYRGKTDFYGFNDHKKLEFRHRKKDAVLGNGIKTSQSIFPEYYLIEVERFHNQIRKDIDEWVYFFKNSEIKPEFKSKNIQKAKEKLDLLKMTPEQRKAYERYKENRRSEKEAIDTAKEEGREERDVEIVRASLKEGLSIEQISRITHLTIAQINSISAEVLNYRTI